MTFFESLLVLLLAAIVLLQVSRRLSVPYPAMLAAAGVVVAFLPGTPDIAIEPETALALFIAPAIVDAAFDFPLGAAFRFWGPLVTFAVVAVLLTAVAVAALGHAALALPWSAALALGAIVSPPDAAAATAVLGSVSIPRSAEEILKGESLFNDATALLLFSGALAVLSPVPVTWGIGVRLGLAAPGGILLGIAAGYFFQFLNRFVGGTLGGNLLQFVNAFLLWIIADRLELSAVLAVVAMAMTLARVGEIRDNPRMRVQSYAVWSAVVFALNVFAFLIMGMQARAILEHLHGPELRHSLRFAGLVIVAVILVRLLVVIGFERLSFWTQHMRRSPRPSRLPQATLIGWSGMRGFVTLATAFALPEAFPQRDTAVLTAFLVVLATLVVQGLTLKPLIHLLHLSDTDSTLHELRSARFSLAKAALTTLDGHEGQAAEALRFNYRIERASAAQPDESAQITKRRELGLSAIRAQRGHLEELRNNNQLGITNYLQLQEEIDWQELTLLSDDERRIEEI